MVAVGKCILQVQSVAMSNVGYFESVRPPNNSVATIGRCYAGKRICRYRIIFLILVASGKYDVVVLLSCKAAYFWCVIVQSRGLLAFGCP